MYSIFNAIAYVLIIVGIALALLSIYVFKKKNLAEAYDAIYDRGYVEKAEKRKKIKEAKKKQATEDAIKRAEKDEPAVQPANNIQINRATPDMHSGQTTMLPPSANSGATTVLSSPSANSGATTVLSSPAANSGATTVLTPPANSGATTVLTPNQARANVQPAGNAQPVKTNSNFVIEKDLYYATSNETVN